MKPVDMLFPRHDPDAGLIGDCFRCSVASILELPAEEVPHFMEADWRRKDPAWYADFHRWLAPRGLAYLDWEIHPDYFGPQWFEQIVLDGGFDVHHVMCGVGPSGELHAVVGRNGVMVHDPHPRRSGLVGPGPHGYRFGFFIARGSRDDIGKEVK